MRYLILFLFCTNAVAEICPKLEFAELDSMPREELLEVHCRHGDAALRLAASNSQQNMRLATKCAEEADRTERILARKYGVKSTGDARTREIDAMCSTRR